MLELNFGFTKSKIRKYSATSNCSIISTLCFSNTPQTHLVSTVHECTTYKVLLFSLLTARAIMSYYVCNKVRTPNSKLDINSLDSKLFARFCFLFSVRHI